MLAGFESSSDSLCILRMQRRVSLESTRGWASPPRPCGGQWCEGATCTTARHLGEERKEACTLSCRCRTGGALKTFGCYSLFSFFYFLKTIGPPRSQTTSKKEAASSLNIFAKCTLSSCESSLSSPLPSLLQPHWLTPGGCLCSTNLARVTLFPFPVPSMLIIILEFFCFVFLGGPVVLKTLKTFHISLRPLAFQRDSGNDFSNDGYSRLGEMRDKASAESTWYI